MTDLTPKDPVERFRYLIAHTPAESGPAVAPVQSQIDRHKKLSRKWRFAGTHSAGRRAALRTITFVFGKRLLIGALTLLAVIYFSHFGLDMARGLGFRVSLLEAVQETGQHLIQMLHGNMGQTAEYGYSRLPVNIAEILPEIIVRSLGLLFASLFLAVMIGIPLGIWAAIRRHTPWSLLTTLGSVLGISMPSFFAALILQIAAIRMTQRVGWTILPVGGFGWDKHMLLPAIVLALRPLAQITRITFISINEQLDQDYVRTARSKGVAPRPILLIHILRNAALPILTTVVLSLRFSLSSLPVVEFFFGWQGLGFHLLKAISGHDDQFTIAMLLCLGLLFIILNFLLDMSYLFIDPRLRSDGSQRILADKLSPTEWLQSLISSVSGFLFDNPITRLFKRSEDSSIASMAYGLQDKDGRTKAGGEVPALERPIRAWIEGTLKNPSFLIGGLLVMSLFVIILFGAQIAPQSPYTTRGLEYEGGEFIVPPFAPDHTYLLGTDMLGRDVLSLILAGAQQTFVLVFLAVVARMTIGFLFGVMSGWWKGGWLDRILLGAAEVISAFPALLLAMTLVLALNIRSGMWPFIVALGAIGWGEIMQFVRSEVTKIRLELFIESAVASGARISRIIFAHVLPNLLPALISIAILEMGAVLMLLGELGFIGIFIGGGAFAELEWITNLFHYSDVPEWGALLSNVRTYARSYPWMGFYPALAFFVGILALNVFGEGLRRLIEEVGAGIMRIFNRYTFAMGALALIAFLSWRGMTGSTATYIKQASEFDGNRAYAQVAALSDPSLEGRALGSFGLEVAANYIAAAYKASDLQAAGEKFTYLQTRKRGFETLDSIPVLIIHDEGPLLKYQQDYTEYAGEHQISGAATANVRFVGLGDVSHYERYGYRYYNLPKFDFSDEILLIFESDLPFLQSVRSSGMLVITSNERRLQRRATLPGEKEWWMKERESQGLPSTSPAFWISEATANRLLKEVGKTTNDLLDAKKNLAVDDVLELPIDTSVTMFAEGQVHKHVPAFNVLGHWPGVLSNQFGGIDDHLIVVLAQYDCPPIHPDGVFHPCANDNASGVGVMLETIRAMQESGYQPYKTFLFIAYSGEGYEGGEPIDPRDVEQFMQAKYGFTTAYEIEAIIELRGLGVRNGGDLLVVSDGSLRLAKLFQSAGKREGVPTQVTGGDVDLSRIFTPGSAAESGEEAPRVRVYWDGWDAASLTADDQLAEISSEDLEQAGRVVSLSLMIIGRELNY